MSRLIFAHKRSWIIVMASLTWLTLKPQISGGSPMNPYSEGFKISLDNLKIVTNENLDTELAKELAEYSQINAQSLPISGRELCLYYTYNMWASLANRDLVEEEGYRKFLSYLRLALETRHYEAYRSSSNPPKEIAYLQKIAFGFYAQNDLSAWQKQLPRLVVSAARAESEFLEFSSQVENTAESRQELFSYVYDKVLHLATVYPLIRASAKYSGHSRFMRYYLSYQGGVTWVKFDPNYLGSLVSVKMIFEKSQTLQKTIFIRMSTPTIGSNEGVRVAPEFLAYLDYLKSHGLSHTYVNFQDTRTHRSKDKVSWFDKAKFFGINNESFRTKAIEQLEKLYPDTFQVISLSRNNAFYEQTSFFRNLSNFKVFSEKFIYELMNERDNGYFLPASWLRNREETKVKLTRLFEALNHMLFDNKLELSRNERKVFIEAAYFFIAIMACEGAFSVNLTCKDGIDRAGAAHGLAYLSILCKELVNGASSQRVHELVEKFEGIIFADALTVKHRALMKGRFDRFYETAQVITKRLAEDPQRFSGISEFLPFDRVSFGAAH